MHIDEYKNIKARLCTSNRRFLWGKELRDVKGCFTGNVLFLSFQRKKNLKQIIQSVSSAW